MSYPHGPPHGHTHIVPDVAVEVLERLGMISDTDQAQAKAIIEAHQGGEIDLETYEELKAQQGWPPAWLLP